MTPKMMKELAEKYPESVLEPYGMMIEKIGFEAVSVFASEFGGTYLYIPHSRAIFSGCVERQVKDEYNGMNIRDLCKKYVL